MTTSARIGLIDYGSGNLRSVAKALQFVGAEVQHIVSGPIPNGLKALVLPGVGSFGDSVRQLRARGLFQPIREWLVSEKRFLGICLGYQLLFQSSEESPGEEGLGLFEGKVQRFKSGGLKIPQIGWNQLAWTKQPFVYFVHSYYPVPIDRSLIAATTTYGEKFAAAVVTDYLFATQFHPEKSQENGLAILRQFVSSLT
jgi:imidazole glycerol-phosphate synthase subunit HisH